MSNRAGEDATGAAREPAAEVATEDWPGARLGLPQTGPGALAPWSTRAVGLVLDWAVSMLLVVIIFGPRVLTGHGASNFATLAAFYLLTTTMITFTGASVGQRLCRVGVARLDGRPVGFPRTALRQLMVCLVLPALVIDGQRRGLQDLALGTVVVRRGRPGS